MVDVESSVERPRSHMTDERTLRESGSPGGGDEGSIIAFFEHFAHLSVEVNCREIDLTKFCTNYKIFQFQNGSFYFQSYSSTPELAMDILL